ncbi:hypothetical protein KEM09_08285 [Carboxylicivirga mesophila]|uniref:Uncharacterized protein n=1 Tax=Carboxylicivirga mesophila TaxID=1166478 RepID=A0ABS5K8Q5_9BACT|nr:hypothetical protein [Carboxylicivirga mesophila]MBS2211395.1 hypothetical protein [Carboxylicivirga mesophila]
MGNNSISELLGDEFFKSGGIVWLQLTGQNRCFKSFNEMKGIAEPKAYLPFKRFIVKY